MRIIRIYAPTRLRGCRSMTAQTGRSVSMDGEPETWRKSNYSGCEDPVPRLYWRWRVARAADAPGLLSNIHRHITRTTTVTSNGDLNPYAVIVAPVSVGKIQQGDVLVDNFNNLSNLQGTGTTIIDYSPSTRQTSLVAQSAAETCAMSGRRRADHGDDDAEERLDHRRQHAQHRRHHPHQGQWLSFGARCQWPARRGLGWSQHQ